MRSSAIDDVLIVEDVQAVALTYARFLKNSGIHCKIVATRKEAIEHLHTQPNCTLVLEINLPDISGFEVLRHVADECPMASVVIVTADDTDITADRALRAGAYDYLVKPVHEERLVTTVRNAKEHSRLRDQLSLSNDLGSQLGCQIAGTVFVALMTLVVGTITFLLLYFIKSSLGIDMFRDTHLQDIITL